MCGEMTYSTDQTSSPPVLRDLPWLAAVFRSRTTPRRPARPLASLPASPRAPGAHTGQCSEPQTCSLPVSSPCWSLRPDRLSPIAPWTAVLLLLNLGAPRQPSLNPRPVAPVVISPESASSPARHTCNCLFKIDLPDSLSSTKPQTVSAGLGSLLGATEPVGEISEVGGRSSRGGGPGWLHSGCRRPLSGPQFHQL